MSVIIGSNLDPQPVPGMGMQRWYNGWLDTMPWLDNGGVMPPDWPQGILKCVSIQPPPQPLIDGDLDADIRRFVATAPRGSMLTIWHEAEGQHYPDIGPAEMRAMHTRMLNLTRGSGVAYGCANCGARAANVAWDIPGLDFYGIDIYDAAGFNISYAAMMNRYLYNVSNRQPNPNIAVLECNSHNPARRPYAFASLYAWLKRQSWQGVFGADRSTALLTYWNPGGALSGRWLADDAATIGALAALVSAETADAT